MKLNKNQLLQIVGKAIENETIDMNSSIQNTDEWDSLSQLSILTDLDDALDGKVSDIEGIAKVESIKEIFDLLKNHSLIE
tara:strand:+ start:179 stop:418 length:240 start_codon:yes stop_codon:yes gene_type:complete